MTRDDAVQRRHWRVGVLGAAAAVVLLPSIVAALPLVGNEDHAFTHVAVGLPLLLLLALLTRRRPAQTSVPAGSLAWRLLLTGVAVSSVSALVEAVGAYGFDDLDNRTNSLADVHDAAVLLAPLGIVGLIAGSVSSLGVALAVRAGAGDSRYVAVGVVLAALLAVAFVVGGMLFGY